MSATAVESLVLTEAEWAARQRLELDVKDKSYRRYPLGQDVGRFLRTLRVKRRSERSDKVVWETVKRVAARAGVRSHVHALRAAFAVAFDEAHPDQVIALKELMGHTRIETTLVYLRRKDRAKAMEQVRDLSWGLGSVPSSQPLEAHTGFEPVLSAEGLQEALRLRLVELTATTRNTVPSPRTHH